MDYESNIHAGVQAMRDWMTAQTLAPRDLPDDVWTLPKDCPLWTLGLSLAQASGILQSVRR